MAHAADDVLDGGEIASVLRGHERDPGSAALALRLFGAVHRLVLTGRAASLAPFYPSVGGLADPDAAWPAFRQVCADNISGIRPWLDRPPQTNEIGRSAPLLGGLLHIAAMTALPVRLAELGASAGLNQRPDLVRLTWEGSSPGAYGPASSPVVLRNAWQGSLPPVGVPLSIVERRGCDLDPVVPTTSEGQIRLASYVWPDDLERLHRLRGAVELARQVPATVVRTDAATFLRGIALEPGRPWSSGTPCSGSTFRRRRDCACRRELDRLSHEATRAAPVAHLSFEPEHSLKAFFVRLRLGRRRSTPVTAPVTRRWRRLNRTASPFPGGHEGRRTTSRSWDIGGGAPALEPLGGWR